MGRVGVPPCEHVERLVSEATKGRIDMAFRSPTTSYRFFLVPFVPYGRWFGGFNEMPASCAFAYAAQWRRLAVAASP